MRKMYSYAPKADQLTVRVTRVRWKKGNFMPYFTDFFPVFLTLSHTKKVQPLNSQRKVILM